MEETETLGQLVDSVMALANVYKDIQRHTPAEMSEEDWEETSDTTNPVESILRKSFKSRNNFECNAY